MQRVESMRHSEAGSQGEWPGYDGASRQMTQHGNSEYGLLQGGGGLPITMDGSMLRLRGLPYRATNDDIVDFFSGKPPSLLDWCSAHVLPVTALVARFVCRENRCFGCAVKTKRMPAVLILKPRQICRSSFLVTASTAADFNVAPEAVHIATRIGRDGNEQGTGIAYVQFSSPEEAEVARNKKHHRSMGPRYIECHTVYPRSHMQHPGMQGESPTKG